MTDSKIRKIPEMFSCITCDYNTRDKKDYNKHLSTAKHARLMKANAKSEKSEKIRNRYTCQCGKDYKHSQSLYTHRKKCVLTLQACKDETGEAAASSDPEIIKPDYHKIIMELIMQNKELQNTIKDIIPKIGTVSNTSNISNTSNTNNINIKIDNITLLNDKCKDALSISDFIDSINITVQDLLVTAQKGLVGGLSHLFLEKLKSLPISLKPIWCSDIRRKKIYIKEDVWSEDINQQKTKAAIKTLAFNQNRSLPKYTQENPDWMEHDSKKDKYISMVKQSTEDLDDIKQTHIINNLLDAVHLTTCCKETLTTN